MRNIALAIIVLAVTIPAMGDVTITIDRDASNKVTIGYECDNNEKVRAFALQIDVNNGAFEVGSDDFAGDPNHDDYYVCPGSISFTVDDGNTVIDDFGNPIADQDPCGGVLEIASLYADNDPCHKTPPADSNDLAIFYLDCNAVDFLVGTITITEDLQRGGVILEDPNEQFVLHLPSPITICEDCLVVGRNIGCVDITDAMFIEWVNQGRPDCWCYPCHCMGDHDGSGTITGADILGSDGKGGAILDGWYDAWNFAYHPCSDIDNNGTITGSDILGSDGKGPPIYDGWYDGWNNPPCP
jgi:hypothetical protein